LRRIRGAIAFGGAAAELETDPVPPLRAAALVTAMLAAVLVSGCASTSSPGSGQAAAAIAAAVDPSGGVPDADLVPAASAVSAYASGPGGLDGLISHYAYHYGVPETLVRRVIVRESNYNPAARNGPYWGLMQIRHDTAAGMGYRGPASGLLDAETNLRYAVRYLAGAYVVAGGNEDRAVRLYASGYYYDAKRAGLLQKSGLR